MCGIIAFLFCYFDEKNILYLKNSIKELLNRGYDSIGISIINKDEFIIRKTIDYKEIDELFEINFKNEKNMMGHTRWATHGGISIKNAHPHIDTIISKFTIIHNGIIENYIDIKNFLEKEKISFYSETDSEVLLNLIVFNYINEYLDDDIMRIKMAINKSISIIEGTYGIVIQNKDYPDKLFCVRKGSPLLLGIDKDKKKIVISSEKQAFPDFIIKYIRLLKDEIVICDILDSKLIEKILNGENNDTNFIENNNMKFEYETKKEIYDQKRLINLVTKNKTRLNQEIGVNLENLDKIMIDLQSIRNICLIGCGTSYHVCQILQNIYIHYGLFDQVLAFDASEFDIDYIPKKEYCGIFISQSGETLDLINVHEIFTKYHPISLSIVNVLNSQLTTMTKGNIYMNIGKEKGVASTKSFTAQIIIGILVLIWFIQSISNQNPNISILIKNINEIDGIINPFIDKIYSECRDRIIPQIKKYNKMFILGKNIDYFIAKEGALKIKEISYRFAEAYPTGSLKHGPFALLDDDILVIYLQTHSNYKLNHIQEIKSRNSKILYISIFDNPYPDNILHISIPEHFFSFIFATVVLQIIAFELSIQSNINPDYPRNLAKVVTVE